MIHSYRSLCCAALAAMGAVLLTGCDQSPSSSTSQPAPAASPIESQVAPDAAAADIWTAAAAGDLETLRKRVSSATDINALDPTFGATALTYAADFGHAECVRYLLDAGAIVDARNRDSSTPLIGAAFFGRSECVRILLDHGADKALTNKDGSTALMASYAPWELTKMIADALNMPLEQQELERGREECRTMLQ